MAVLSAAALPACHPCLSTRALTSVTARWWIPMRWSVVARRWAATVIFRRGYELAGGTHRGGGVPWGCAAERALSATGGGSTPQGGKRPPAPAQRRLAMRPRRCTPVG